MKVLWYLLTVVFGLFGALAGLRTIEHVASDGNIMPGQILVAVVALVLAGVCVKKARSAATQS